MLYGKPIKHVRHVNEETLTIGPQRYQLHLFWRHNTSATSRTDGLDLKDETHMPEGSIVTKHKTEILVTPETIEPQQLYIGRVKLSFSDVYNHAICGGRFSQASFQDTATEDFTAKTNAITPGDWFGFLQSGKTTAAASFATDLEIGQSGSGFGIKEWMLDDHIKHWCNLKKVTVFDQRPLMGERWQRVPSKVKRINEGTAYALLIFNDSVRGATPADTQVTVNIKDYFEELAL